MNILAIPFLIGLALTILGIAACAWICKAHDDHQAKRRNRRR